MSCEIEFFRFFVLRYVTYHPTGREGMAQRHLLSGFQLASYPGPSHKAKRGPGTHCVCMRVIFPVLGGFVNLMDICRRVRILTVYIRVTKLIVRDDVFFE